MCAFGFPTHLMPSIRSVYSCTSVTRRIRCSLVWIPGYGRFLAVFLVMLFYSRAGCSALVYKRRDDQIAWIEGPTCSLAPSRDRALHDKKTNCSKTVKTPSTRPCKGWHRAGPVCEGFQQLLSTLLNLVPAVKLLGSCKTRLLFDCVIASPCLPLSQRSLPSLVG
ncbi:hypothetical protein F5Y16DRAFT_375479 [Xylariaceae sp. FL0255]|nr:hypothetical protein F5Y16DRAFT_375479 [Xylariaceae sp. FL0255]